MPRRRRPRRRTAGAPLDITPDDSSTDDDSDPLVGMLVRVDTQEETPLQCESAIREIASQCRALFWNRKNSEQRRREKRDDINDYLCRSPDSGIDSDCVTESTQHSESSSVKLLWHLTRKWDGCWCEQAVFGGLSYALMSDTFRAKTFRGRRHQLLLVRYILHEQMATEEVISEGIQPTKSDLLAFVALLTTDNDIASDTFTTLPAEGVDSSGNIHQQVHRAYEQMTEHCQRPDNEEGLVSLALLVLWTELLRTGELMSHSHVYIYQQPVAREVFLRIQENSYNPDYILRRLVSYCVVGLRFGLEPVEPFEPARIAFDIAYSFGDG